MATTIIPEELYFGAPASLTYGGVEVGATIDAPTVNFDITVYTPEFQGARGPVKGTEVVTRVIPRCNVRVNQVTAQKLGWVLPGSTATSSVSVGQVAAGYDTTLAADPAQGATNVKVTSVTTVLVNDFVRINPAGNPLEANSEVVQVLTVGTTGGGGTGLDIQTSSGGGLLLDHANGEQIVKVTGTLLAAPATAGATNIKVDSVTGLTANDYVRIGYAGHYETRQVTVVGTTGPAGTGLTFVVPLTRDHGLDEWVIEVTAQGGTSIGWTPGRIPSAAYQTLILSGAGLDGRVMTVTLLNAMSSETQEITFGDDAMSGFAGNFIAHYDPATPTVAPFSILLQ